MKCLSCGFELDDDAVFCSQCGKKIELPAETLTEDIKSADDAVSDVKEEAVETVSALVEVAEMAADKAEEIVSEVTDAANEKPLSDTVFADTNDTVAAIDEALEALSSQAETLPEAAAEEISDTADVLADDIKNKAEESADKIEESIEAEIAPEPAAPEIKPLKKRENPPVEAPAETAAPLCVQNQTDGTAPQQPYSQQLYAPYNEQYDAPVQEEAEAPAKVGALRVSFAGFIAIVTIIFLILVSLLFCVRIGCSGRVLENRTKHMNINTVLDADLGKHSLSDAIYNEVGFSDASQGEVSKADFRAYLAKTDLLEYTGGFVRDYADYFIEGEIGDPSVNANDMADFFVQNDDVAKECFDHELRTADYNRIRTRLELKDTADNFSIEKWSRKVHFDLANLSFVFSYVTLGILLGLVIVLLVWIAVIVDGKGKHIVGMYGSIFSCSGGIVFVVGLAAAAGTSIAHIATGWFIFYLCASLLLPFGALALGIGAVELVIGFIFKRIRRGIKNSDKRNKAVEKALLGV